jgi:prolyl oligopeptidase PreP (S9A serine peptidase family)
MGSITYPFTVKVDQVDDYHGTQVPDPYRWLEDTYSPETNAWIEAQNKLTFTFLEQIPVRKEIQARLTELWDYPKASAPFQRGGRYFQFRNTGLQNQDVLFVQESLAGEGRVLIDPNGLSTDGTVALTSWAASEDGRWLAYATSASGSDWLTWRVRDVNTGQDLPDVIEWSKFSGAVLPAVGVMDMLRFHKFTIGWAWVSDFGSSDDPEGFRYLHAYSPLHNLQAGRRYPATLITTADHDDRVVPGHSFKFAAALQAAQAGDAPTLIRIQTKAGHGMGKPTAIIIQEQADIWAFLVRVLEVGS